MRDEELKTVRLAVEAMMPVMHEVQRPMVEAVRDVAAAIRALATAIHGEDAPKPTGKGTPGGQ